MVVSIIFQPEGAVIFVFAVLTTTWAIRKSPNRVPAGAAKTRLVELEPLVPVVMERRVMVDAALTTDRGVGVNKINARIR